MPAWEDKKYKLVSTENFDEFMKRLGEFQAGILRFQDLRIIFIFQCLYLIDFGFLFSHTTIETSKRDTVPPVIRGPTTDNHIRRGQ